VMKPPLNSPSSFSHLIEKIDAALPDAGKP
jgi:hypothetical protein